MATAIRNDITGLAYGKAGYVHAGGIDRPLFMTDGRVPNYNWRGLVESSSWADGAPADCSIMTGTCTTIARPGKVGVYMKPGPGGSTSNAAQWVGNVIQNGAGSTGLLFRRNRSFDPSTGQCTQQDPIGIAGGLNLYGYANGDPINFSDPFGRCPDSTKDKSGKCPGGLSDEEWDKVETAAKECLSAPAGDRILTALSEGRVRGGDFGSTMAKVRPTSPDVIRLNRDRRTGDSPFATDSYGLARVLAHEDRHVQQLRELDWIGRFGGGVEPFRSVIEEDARGYARAHNTCGR